MPTTLESSLPAAALARRLCDKPEFQRYLGVADAEAARAAVRKLAKVETLAELDHVGLAVVVSGFGKGLEG